jgi:copper(I)-binding protein
VNRALRAATLGVLVLSPLALSACSAGQVTQTATQQRDKTGPMAQVGGITLRQIELAYPSGGQYERGDDAEVRMAIVNTGNEDDALVGIDGEGFERVRITGGGTAAGSTTGAGSTGSTGSREIDIPAGSTLYLGENGPTVTLAGLQEDLTSAQTVELTLTFENAGEVTVPAVVATPDRDLPRGDAFNFHEEETNQEESDEASGGGNPEAGG